MVDREEDTSIPGRRRGGIVIGGDSETTKATAVARQATKYGVEDALVDGNGYVQFQRGEMREVRMGGSRTQNALELVGIDADGLKKFKRPAWLLNK